MERGCAVEMRRSLSDPNSEDKMGGSGRVCSLSSADGKHRCVEYALDDGSGSDLGRFGRKVTPERFSRGGNAGILGGVEFLLPEY